MKTCNEFFLDSFNEDAVSIEKSSYLWTKPPVIIKRKQKLQRGKLNVVELFCGCGGTSLGFEMADYQTVLGIDILEPAISTFVKNHPTATAILGDIRQISTNMILKQLPSKVDVVIAGIPCQGFSLNNRKRNDFDERNFLYKELLRILSVIKPNAVMVENVSGIRSSLNGEIMESIEKGILETCGLKVKHKLLTACEYGVPQIRKRVVFIGVKNAEGFNFDEIIKTHGPGCSKPFNTVYDAIGDLPIIKSGGATNTYTNMPETEYQVLMRNGCDKLLNHVAPTHPQETIDKIANTIPGEPMYPRFKQRIRLKWDDLSPTQVSGGIRPQFQFGHPAQARGLTIRERCRIQSFPDTFEVMGGLVQARVQTGNAVPPLLAKAVATALKKYLK